MTFRISAGTLLHDDAPLLGGVAAQVACADDALGVGVFLRVAADAPLARHQVALGRPVRLRRFTACHRYDPFWMKPMAGGASLAEVPPETQFLLCELEDGRCLLLVPLVEGTLRWSLRAIEDGVLALVGETGDPFTLAAGGIALFAALGDDPYALLADGARAVMARLGTGRLRRDKPLPDFIDVFGWCTWDAFYQEVSQAKVREGLESFARAGLRPRLLILDDGWQRERTLPTGERRLTAFAANDKFPGDLAPTVAMAKGEFGVETFLVWHAVIGYWGGVDGEALPGYEVRDSVRQFSPGLRHHQPAVDEWWGQVVGLVPGAAVARFYHDYHRHLRRQGVDGVKIDNQAVLESLASGQGGRVALTHAYREALEGSAAVHFGGRVINCMSCASETFYAANATTILRTSTDFWPKRPESHGLHLYGNAQVSAWFGEFVHPDWDMFQSAHAMGGYHAAGRAVGGCQIYVSDKPGEHDFALLRKLVLSDGSVLRAQGIGRPTRDCLFRDPTREDVLLKIFNLNAGSALVGAFNARHHPLEAERVTIVGHVAPEDAVGLPGEDFALYAHQQGRLVRAARADRLAISLPELAFELVTIVAIERGVAPIGLVDKFNSGAAVAAKGWTADGAYALTLRDGGRLVLWSERAPRALLVDGAAQEFTYDAATCAVACDLGKAGEQEVRVEF